jgi:putative acetyltransferase
MLTIRRETTGDIPAIRIINKAAFGQADEAILVDALRRSGALTLSGVAILENNIVGHIAFSPVAVESAETSFAALALAPMAVLPEYQRQGIGSALVRWGLEECRRLGYGLVIVVGHAEYYPRFGFYPASGHDIKCPFLAPPEALMLIELIPGALVGRGGTIRYRPEFDMV